MSDAATPIRCLIIDDHRMFADSLSRLLADEQDIAVVGVIGDGAAAAQQAVALDPHVVLVDYQMPGTDGVEIARAIKHQQPAIMVVMITGSNDDRVLLAAIDAGCSGFMTKDRAASEVADAVRAAAAGEALISPAQLSRLLPKLSRTYRTVGDDLTKRELDTLRYLAKGIPNKAIANEMNLSLSTVRNYVQSVLTKLGAHSKLEAVSMAVRAGIIDYANRP